MSFSWGNPPYRLSYAIRHNRKSPHTTYYPTIKGFLFQLSKNIAIFIIQAPAARIISAEAVVAFNHPFPGGNKSVISEGFSSIEKSRESVSGRIEQKRFRPASILQGWASYYTYQKQRNNNHERRNDMFGFTALVVTLIGSTVVGLGTGFAIVCATEGWERTR